MMIEVLNAAVAAIQAGKSAALATVVESSGATPAKPGFKMLLTEDGVRVGTVGGGALEHKVLEAAREVLAQRRSSRLALTEDCGGLSNLGMACGGGIEVFVEYLTAGPEVCIFGGGHVGVAVAELAAFAGFRVVLVDDREEFANAERTPFAHDVHVYDMPEFASGYSGGPDRYVVIVTRGHSFDEQVLEAVLRQDPLPFYVGMMGSKSKVDNCFASLRGRGIPDEVIGCVHAPIGLPIGGDTPREIAVSIVAQMVAARHGRDTRSSYLHTPS